MEADPFDSVMTELLDEGDNRRLQISDILKKAHRDKKPFGVIAFGNIASDVDSIALPNGHVYRPWPRSHMMRAGRKILSQEFELMRRGEYVFHADVDVGSLETKRP